MKHAGAQALDQLEPLLGQIRTLPGLKERKRGIFYRKGRSFLHFHEDPKGLFADVLCGGETHRFQVSEQSGQDIAMGYIRTLLNDVDHPKVRLT